MNSTVAISTAGFAACVAVDFLFPQHSKWGSALGECSGALQALIVVATAALVLEWPLDPHALHVASFLSLIATSFFLGTSLYIAYNDLSGRWKDKRMFNRDADTTHTVYTYLKYLPYTVRDLVLIMPLCLYAMVHTGFIDYAYLTRPLAQVSWPTELAICVLQYLVQKCFNMLAHMLFHTRPLYILIHKRHHVPSRDMVPTATWRATVIEYVCMELLGNFIIGPMLFPMHLSTIALSYAYVGIGAAADHCGYGEINFLIDGEHHYWHHKIPTVNYSEFALFDTILGTMYSPPVQADVVK